MPKTYNDYYIEVRRALKEHDISGYNLEAKLLVASAAEKTTAELMRDLRLYTSDSFADTVNGYLSRRLAGEPAAYITGSWEFYGLPILVSRDVIIPRIDTEVLAQTAIEYLKLKKPDARVMDLCCGSGCIACAIAKELPGTKVVAADISREALSIARKNVLLNGLSPRVACVEADAISTPPMLVGSFDLMVSNPPYIPTADLDELETSVKDHEPRLALDGGEDGLDFYRSIIKNWKPVLRPGGAIMLEVGIGQASEVKKMLLTGGFRRVESLNDTGGIERVVCGLL